MLDLRTHDAAKKYKKDQSKFEHFINQLFPDLPNANKIHEVWAQFNLIYKQLQSNNHLKSLSQLLLKLNWLEELSQDFCRTKNTHLCQLCKSAWYNSHTCVQINLRNDNNYHNFILHE